MRALPLKCILSIAEGNKKKNICFVIQNTYKTLEKFFLLSNQLLHVLKVNGILVIVIRRLKYVSKPIIVCILKYTLFTSNINTRVYDIFYVVHLSYTFHINHILCLLPNITDPPHVNFLPQQNIIEGRNLSVKCSTTFSNPSTTTFFWTKDDSPEFKVNGAILKIPFIQKNISGIYRCTAENIYSNLEKGSDSQSMVINVLCKCSIVCMYIIYKFVVLKNDLLCQQTLRL